MFFSICARLLFSWSEINALPLTALPTNCFSVDFALCLVAAYTQFDFNTLECNFYLALKIHANSTLSCALPRLSDTFLILASVLNTCLEVVIWIVLRTNLTASEGGKKSTVNPGKFSAALKVKHWQEAQHWISLCTAVFSNPRQFKIKLMYCPLVQVINNLI